MQGGTEHRDVGNADDFIKRLVTPLDYIMCIDPDNCLMDRAQGDLHPA